MSLRTLEMQVALPKSVEWGMMLERMNHHPYLVQERLAQYRQKKEERIRKRTEGSAPSSYQTFSHPFKGRFLDRSV